MQDIVFLAVVRQGDGAIAFGIQGNIVLPLTGGQGGTGLGDNPCRFCKFCLTIDGNQQSTPHQGNGG